MVVGFWSLVFGLWSLALGRWLRSLAYHWSEAIHFNDLFPLNGVILRSASARRRACREPVEGISRAAARTHLAKGQRPKTNDQRPTTNLFQSRPDRHVFQKSRQHGLAAFRRRGDDHPV